MVEITTTGDIQYTKSNRRVRYNPELHENHCKSFTTDELAYMCYRWDKDRKADIAMSLGRTHSSVLSTKQRLVSNNLFDYYKSLGQDKFGI